MFALQEQRECVMLQVIDTGSQCRKPDGPNSEASGVEGLAFLAHPTEPLETVLPKDCSSETCSVLGMPQCYGRENQFEMI